MPRCFIALTPPTEFLDAVGGAQSELRQGMDSEHSLRWTRREQFHLTLLFLGDVRDEDLPPLAAGLESACAEASSFTLTMGDPGVFPSAHRPRVLWLGVGGDLESLERLRAEVVQQCARYGGSGEGGTFRPHLTLARMRNPHRGLGKELEQLFWERNPRKETAWTVDEVKLIASTLTPTGATYETLRAIPIPL